MRRSQKPVAQQVIVVTGASSGIGLATAVTAAKRGAKVVLSGRSAGTLSEVTATITDSGGEAIHVVADVSQRAEVQAIADAAISRFGRIDTWVTTRRYRSTGGWTRSARKTADACSTPTSGVW